MTFPVGQTIAHPFHGLAIVRGHRTRTVRGEARDYLDLEVRHDGLRVSVPVDTVEEVGLRPLLSRGEIDELFDVLRADDDGFDKSWAQRIKKYQQQLATGTGEAKATIVRQIVRSKGAHPTAGAERELLEGARTALAEEFAAVLDVSVDEAAAQITEAALTSA